MRFYFFLLIVWLGLVGQAAFAHDVNSPQTSRNWFYIQEGKTHHLEGYFLMFKDSKVFIETPDKEIKTFPLQALSPNDQKYVNARHQKIEKLNQQLASGNNINQEVGQKGWLFFQLFLFAAAIIMLVMFIATYRKNNKVQFVYPVLGLLSLACLFGFKKPNTLGTDPAFIDSAFAPFKPKVYTRWDANYFYVESNGIPDHQMMVGITGWQQQVPIPQCYMGSNAWSIPLNPVNAATPVPVNASHFLRGAVAIAANGIPIFNPYTNTGADAYLTGQLDNFGGHCGRADDYHYHTAPLSLYNQTQATLPIAFALDGYAIYGAKEPDGSAMATLDANHGHVGTNGVYHYHGTASAPYMIGNMVGQVTEDATLQIIPQAAARGVRPATNPLNGAVITNCQPNSTNTGYTLTYTLSNQTYSIEYSWTTAGAYTFKFINPTGTTTSNYTGTAICNLPTSVDEYIKLDKQITVYPNPFHNNQFSVLLDGNLNAADIKEISVYTQQGQQLFISNKYLETVYLPQTAEAVYFVKISLTNNQSISKKITTR